MTDQRARASDLEPAEIEVRNPTVVVSARLDADLARQLTKLARQQNRRLSDLLREAAAIYAAVAAQEVQGPEYVASWPGGRVSLGMRHETHVGARPRAEAVVPWESVSAYSSTHR